MNHNSPYRFGLLGCLLSVFVSACPVVAQVTMTVVKGSSFAQADSSWNHQPWTGYASAGSSNGWCSSGARAMATMVNGLKLTLSTDTSATNWVGASCQSSASGSSHGVVRLSSPTPVAGVIHITGSGYVDVGDDRAVEFRSSSGGSMTIPVVVTVAGIDIYAGVSASSVSPAIGGSNSDREDLTMEFSTSAVGLATHLPACGPDLSVWRVDTATRTELQFVVSNSVVSPHAFFVVGLSRRAVPIFPSNCVLGTDIVIPALVVLSPMGSVKQFSSLPRVAGAGSIYVQFIVASYPNRVETWETSNLVELIMK